jgi:hypothetical protein
MSPFTRRTALAVLACAAPSAVLAATATHVILYKNPQCDCCEGYAKYLRQDGFSVTVTPTNDLYMMSRRAGFPEAMDGCHISEIGGYVVQGHVPIAAIRRLSAERPAIRGISLPGMPAGSPGMPGAKQAPFVIYAIGRDGRSSVYMTV